MILNRKTRYAPQIIIEHDDYAEIVMGDIYGNEVARCKIDLIDLPIIGCNKWYLDSVGYARTTINDKKVRLHSLLLSTIKGQVVDHINDDKLDNRRVNLQVCSHSENIQKAHRPKNKHGVTGIYKTRSNTWMAFIEVNGTRYTKNYKLKEYAIIQRFIWELKYYGKFSPQMELIKSMYPNLVNVMTLENMRINDDIELVTDILGRLKLDSHCPCMIIKNENTICPCLPCRVNQHCCCGLYVEEVK